MEKEKLKIFNCQMPDWRQTAPPMLKEEGSSWSGSRAEVPLISAEARWDEKL